MRNLLPLAAAALAGCVTLPPEGAPGAYRALGTEPFWSVTIADGRMSYDAPDGPRFSVPAPAPRPTPGGRRYETARLVLDIRRQSCSDGMSDRIYADSVRATVDGRPLSGCGGEILPPATLADTAWAIVAIDGTPVGGERYSLSFTADRVSGQAGCNRFSGGYSAEGDRLTLGPVAATRMACPGPAMEHERRTLQLLQGVIRAEHPDGDSLILSGNNVTIRLRRSI
jgi:heat shock protein HslJ